MTKIRKAQVVLAVAIATSAIAPLTTFARSCQRTALQSDSVTPVSVALIAATSVASVAPPGLASRPLQKANATAHRMSGLHRWG